MNEALFGDLDQLFEALNKEDQKIKLESMLEGNE